MPSWPFEGATEADAETARPMRPHVNDAGPKCDRCGVRPDDPMWCDVRAAITGTRPRDPLRSLLCLGCVADLRRIRRLVFVRSRAVTRWLDEGRPSLEGAE